VSSPATLSRPNSSQGLCILRDLQPDLIISIRYRRILRDEAIAIPAKGVINLHSGILPDYRGVMATFWAMLAGEKEIGSTLHWIVDSGIDTGPVIESRRRATRPETSYLVNVLGLYAEGCEMIANAVHTIAADRELPFHGQAAKGPYFGAPGTADVRHFEAAGLSLFDGREAAEIRD
jgi:methionyl-tRNA formyltransferase